MSVLPREVHVSWDAHMAGAMAGVLAALLWRNLDVATPEPKRSWELEEEAANDADSYEPPRPDDVPVLWHRAEGPRGVVLRFPAPRREAGGNTDADQ